jgi:hypothetical protein
MTNNDQRGGADHEPGGPREATQQGAPERELELKLKKDPGNDDAKVDVGSDESMDASDPVAAASPGGGEPAPSSGFPEDK